jgi:hypothetical protein
VKILVHPNTEEAGGPVPCTDEEQTESDIKGSGGGLICAPVPKLKSHGLCNNVKRQNNLSADRNLKLMVLKF